MGNSIKNTTRKIARLSLLYQLDEYGCEKKTSSRIELLNNITGLDKDVIENEWFAPRKRQITIQVSVLRKLCEFFCCKESDMETPVHEYEGKFANNLQTYLKDRNITHQNLADELSLSKDTIDKWTQGSTMPDFETLCYLCDRFKCDLDYFTERLNKEDDIKSFESKSRQIKAIQDLTGLSPDLIEGLINHKKLKDDYMLFRKEKAEFEHYQYTQEEKDDKRKYDSVSSKLQYAIIQKDQEAFEQIQMENIDLLNRVRSRESQLNEKVDYDTFATKAKNKYSWLNDDVNYHIHFTSFLNNLLNPNNSGLLRAVYNYIYPDISVWMSDGGNVTSDWMNPDNITSTDIETVIDEQKIKMTVEGDCDNPIIEKMYIEAVTRVIQDELNLISKELEEENI